MGRGYATSIVPLRIWENHACSQNAMSIEHVFMYKLIKLTSALRITELISITLPWKEYGLWFKYRWSKLDTFLAQIRSQIVTNAVGAKWKPVIQFACHRALVLVGVLCECSS